MGVENQNENTGSTKIKETFKETLKKVPESNKESVAKLLEEMTKEKGKITQATRNDWKNLSYDVRKSIQESVGAKADGKIGNDTLTKIQSKVEAVKPTESVKIGETKKEEVKPTKTPKVEEPKEEEVEPTETKETISSKYINDSIKKIENILKNGIQSGEEEDLTTLIKELQDKKVLKAIPGIVDGKLKKGQDLISVGEDVVDRLEKIAKNLEKAEDNKNDLDEKTAKDEAKKTKDTLDAKSKKEKLEIEKFETDLGKIDMTSMINNLNTQIEAKNNLQTPDILEEQVGFQDKKDALKSKLDKVKLSSDNKTLSDLTGTTSVEKDDKGNLTLKFNLDPKGFDKFDSSKTYNVKLSSTNLDSQKSAILGEVEKAYSEQISDLTK